MSCDSNVYSDKKMDKCTKEKLAIIILAAGESKRFGSPKQLALWEGLPLLQRVVDLVIGLGFKPWVALGGHRNSIIRHEKINLEYCQIVNVDDWSKGLSASIKATLGKLIKEQKALQGVIFLLADQPLLGLQELEKLFYVVDEDSTQIICSEYLLNGRASVGVPAYFPQQYFESLMLLEGDKGAKQVIQENQYKAVPMNKRLYDIDTPEDLLKLEGRCSEKVPNK